MSLRHSELSTALAQAQDRSTFAILAGMTHGFGEALLAASFNSGWYQAVLVVHLASAVVGFGGSAAGTVMLRLAWADGPHAAAAVRRSHEFASNRLTDAAAYLAGVAGVVAVLIDDRWNFRQGWVTFAFVLYFAWAAIAHGAIRPTSAKLAEALEAGDGRADEAQRLRRRAELWAMASNLVIVAAIAVMVTKPGL